MPLEHFRQRQQTIYWIVAILVIPSFVLVWGTGTGGGGPGSGSTRAVLFGDALSDMQIKHFMRRMDAVFEERGVQFQIPTPWNPWQGQPVDRHYSAIYSITLLRAAEQAGVQVGDREIAYFVRNLPSMKAVQKETDSVKVENELQRILDLRQVSRAEFMQGVEDWLKIEQFVRIMDETPIVTDHSGYLTYAQNKSKFTYRRLKVHITEAMNSEAYNRVAGITKENPDGDEEMLSQRIESYLMRPEVQSNRRFWSKPKFRFEYVLAPFKTEKKRYKTIDEEELRSYYNTRKQEFEGKKTFEEAREMVQKAVVEEKQRNAAENAITRGDLETYFRTCILKQKSPVLAEIAKLNGAVVNEIKVGNSGDTLQNGDEFETGIKALGRCREVVEYLNDIDAMKDITKREEEIARLKMNFDSRNPPLATAEGIVRIRVLEYVPGKMRPLRDGKGNMDGTLRTAVILDLQKEEAMELAKIEAEKYATRLEAGDTKGLNTLETDTGDYNSVPRQLLEAGIGKPEIVPSSTGKGWDILVLSKREIPTRDEFLKLPEEERQSSVQMNRYRRRGLHFQLRYGIIMPGKRLWAWLENAEKTKQIEIYRPENQTR